MFTSSLSRLWGSLFPRGLARSPFLPVIVLAILVLAPLLAWRMHRLGRFHTMKAEIKGDSGAEQPRPGGMDPVVLTVPVQPDSDGPHLTSVTLLPGLGTSVLQITASLPGVGSVPLLAAPSVSQLVNGQDVSPSGFNDDRGAIEFPWAGELVGPVTPVGNGIQIPWQGKQLEASTEASAHAGIAEGGMLWMQSADTVSKGSPANRSMTAVYTGMDGGDHWPSKNDISVKAELSPDALILTLDVKNTGDAAEPVGAGWHPRILLPYGHRSQMLLQMPAGDKMQINSQGLPTGRLEPTGNAERFVGHPAVIGASSFDETIVQPKAHGADDGISFMDPLAGYGLRLVPLSPSIKVLRIVSPEDAAYISLGAQTNLDDPYGREWTPPRDGGMMTLQPGDTYHWAVRLEIFPVHEH